MNIIGFVILIVIGIPVLWVAWALFDGFVIGALKKRYSYLVDRTGPIERGGGFYFSYYEKGKELKFFGDDPDETFYLPNEELWRSTMPEFFRDRYTIIMERLRRKMSRRMPLKFVADYTEDCSILYVDYSKTGSERVIKFGGRE